MPHCQVDETLQRIEVAGFRFPLGVYPVEPMEPKTGYTSDFEPADGDDESGEWEEWPDRYVWDIVVSSERVPALWRQLVALFPGRLYPILDYIGHDAYREIDPYIAYELVGVERLIDGVRRAGPFLFEDGMVGFGAVSEEPFFYVFVDEHKIVTVRAETALRERVEKLLEAFGLRPVEAPAGADAAAHEHRSVLLAPPDRPELLSPEEVVERLRDDWRLVLNVDTETNLDDDGNDLGTTGWRCLVRVSEESRPEDRYAEVYLSADSLREAEELSQEAARELVGPTPAEGWTDVMVIAADRMTPEQFGEATGQPVRPARKRGARETTARIGVVSCRWLGENGSGG
jgi:hypothetical protein